jgi:DNA helicase HerA-like ATPase
MNLENLKAIGKVESVDTGTLIIKVEKEEYLNSLQVNNLVAIRSTKTGEKIIGLITKIMRKSSDKIDDDNPDKIIVENIVKVILVGTFLEKSGTKKNVFKRTLETVPSIDTDCFLLEGDELSKFMNSLTYEQDSAGSLNIGKYTLSKNADAYLDGNKFFQRHAVVVGSTGSGKSWTVANILEKASNLPSVNCIIFDIHGEYRPLNDFSNTTLLKISGPTDNEDSDNLIFLPYWLLTYEEIGAMLLDRSDQNAPNQARILFDLIIKYKKETLEKEKQEDVLNNFTIDSPIPYDIRKVLKELEEKDKEMVPGASKPKQGPLHGKLTRFIQRLKSKQSDKRLNFIFNGNETLQEYDWFQSLVNKLIDFENGKGCKIVDFSQVPSDILPLITGLIARLVFSVQQWMKEDKRHPIALFCDEAHLYIPSQTKNSIEERGLNNFERIAKEGRKYGLALIVISQRPADVSKTVLSQCGNFIAMRLSNPDDQNVIKRLFPDSLGNFADLLPILDIGEALVVGDACLLPSRIRISEPKIKPNSATIDFWDEWNKTGKEKGLEEAVKALRKQGK